MPMLQFKITHHVKKKEREEENLKLNEKRQLKDI